MDLYKCPTKRPNELVNVESSLFSYVNDKSAVYACGRAQLHDPLLSRTRNKGFCLIAGGFHAMRHATAWQSQPIKGHWAMTCRLGRWKQACPINTNHEPLVPSSWRARSSLIFHLFLSKKKPQGLWMLSSIVLPGGLVLVVGRLWGSGFSKQNEKTQARYTNLGCAWQERKS